MSIFLGSDWSHSLHEACFLNARGQDRARLTVPHTAEGFTPLDLARAKLGVTASEGRVDLETAHFHDLLAAPLS